MDFKNSMQTVNWIKLLKPTGLKKMDEYIERGPMAGELFSRLKLKMSYKYKSRHNLYNDFLRYRGLEAQYPEFTIGDKMYIAYLRPNPYHIEVMGYNGYNDPPAVTELIDKYIDRDGLFDSIIRNKLEGVYDDIGWSLNLNKYKEKFF